MARTSGRTGGDRRGGASQPSRRATAVAALVCSLLAGFTLGATIPVDGGTDFF